MANNSDLESHPEWLKDLIIYEISTRTFTSPNGIGSGTFRSTADKIPYLHQLGINAIWLTGHSLADPAHFYNIWTQYAVVEPDKLDPALGTEEDFRHLIDVCHQHDIRVILDLITHGVMANSPLVHRHPDWFSGESWGMIDYAFSSGNSELDEWWVDLWTRYIVEYEIDGFRLDLGMRRPDLWHRIRANARAAGREIVVMNESEYAETIDWCEQSGMTDLASIEEFAQIIDFVQRDRDTLLDPHHKISGEINDHVGRAHDWGISEWETWLDNAMDTRSQDWQWSTVQLSCHDDGWEDFEGTNPYVARGSRFIFGYGALFSGLIPMFMAGEEFDVEYMPLPTLSPKLFGAESLGLGTWLYGGVVRWELLEQDRHRQMMLDVKRLIEVRKREYKMLAATPNSQKRNLERIEYTSESACVSPYMRWAKDKMIVVVGNHYTDRSLTVSVKLPQTYLSQATHFIVTDLWTDQQHRHTQDALRNLSVTASPDKTRQGGLALLKIEPVG